CEDLDEYAVGFGHAFGNSGVSFGARYNYRRIKRIIEDNAELSVEAFQGGTAGPCPGGSGDPCFFAQNYFISNPSKAQDLFINPVQVDYFSAPDPTGAIDPTVGAPTDCTSSGSNLTLYSSPVDTTGNNVVVNRNH